LSGWASDTVAVSTAKIIRQAACSPRRISDLLRL
jgi:hypothetical protein